jgi:hypothetical protein
LLVGLVAGATYAGTSSLFAAYLAGVITSWFDSLVHKAARPAIERQSTDENPATQQVYPGTDQHATRDPSCRDSAQANHEPKVTGTYVYEHYYHGPVNRLLIPMFFVSTFPTNYFLSPFK